MATTVPGGAYLDKRGRPQNAEGDRIDGLPDSLSDEERATCRDAGLIAQKQINHYTAGQLAERFGLPDEVISSLKDA